MVGVNAMSLKLPPALSRKVRSAAKRQKLTPELFVVKTLEAELKNKRPAAKPSLLDQASDLCGSITGGPTDVARNPRHLKGYGGWKR